MKLLLYLLQFVLLFAGWTLMFAGMKYLKVFSKIMRRGKEGMDEISKKRLLENRRQLLLLEKENSIWYRLEQELNYSGLKRVFPYLTAEFFVFGNLLLGAFLFVGALFVGGMKKAILIPLIVWIAEYGLLTVLKGMAYRSVNRNLLKFLDFLGNYSITAGELTKVFHQVSKYMEAPLKTVLEECSFEAQTTGDVSLALLVMAEKIEHPKFKEIVRNMEVSVRYCADFGILVESSRKSMREYLRMCEERKGVAREAFINMVMLAGMSVATLLAVDCLIETSIWEVLLQTVPGRIGLCGMAFLFGMFLSKVYRVEH